jgi:hypothetical protein
VGFNQKHTAAVVYTEIVSCSECGVGSLHFLRKEANQNFVSENVKTTIVETVSRGAIQALGNGELMPSAVTVANSAYTGRAISI